jgi:flagellar protein FliS
MFYNAHDAYLESRVLSADPLELVRLLYQGAIGAVQDARHHLANKRIAERSRAISQAYDILMELRGALDETQGGEIAGRLAALYDYMQRKLLEANLQQSDGPLGEVLSLLSTLAEAWTVIARPAKSEARAESPWAPPVAEGPVAARASGGWSL